MADPKIDQVELSFFFLLLYFFFFPFFLIISPQKWRRGRGREGLHCLWRSREGWSPLDPQLRPCKKPSKMDHHMVLNKIYKTL